MCWFKHYLTELLLFATEVTERTEKTFAIAIFSSTYVGQCPPCDSRSFYVIAALSLGHCCAIACNDGYKKLCVLCDLCG